MGIQDFGPGFNLEKFYHARDVARDLTHELASLIRPGMQEADAHRMYKDLCTKKGITKQWHPPKLRFGPNTLKNFSEVSEPWTLQEDDLFFIDIGPVIDGHEADYGETFSVGSSFDYKHIADSAQKLFHSVSEYQNASPVRGQKLYEYADKKARELGYHLNMGSDGHRIGDFPHQIFFKGSLPECEETVIPNAWILEIHLWSPDKKFGAFYEDVLK
jgi:methionyl aminopeptidase